MQRDSALKGDSNTQATLELKTVQQVKTLHVLSASKIFSKNCVLEESK